MAAHPDFEQRLAEEWPPERWQDVTVLLAVSGGADSVALLRALAALRPPGRGRLIVGHFNHGLRGAESDGDAAFVGELCRALGIACETGHRPTVPCPVPIGSETEATPPSVPSSEAASRDARYQFLRETARRVGARYVATAHTADDQAETVLHRILRGTGIAGLAGIRRARTLLPGVSLIRPLLRFRRTEVVEYLQALGQPYRVDSSNRDPRFTRNRIRSQLLPLLAEHYNAEVAEALTRLATHAAEFQAVLDDSVTDLLARCVRGGLEGRVPHSSAGDAASPWLVTIDCAGLAGVQPLLIRELLAAVWRRQGWPLRDMSDAKWRELVALVVEDGAERVGRRRTVPGGIVVERRGHVLALLAPACSGQSENSS